jgi:serine/threonine protein phosphatase PrpC
MMFSVFQVSRIGGRKKNEDRMGYSYTPGSAIFLVADGLGGHPKGEVAAQICMQVVTSMFHKQATPKLPNVAEFLHSALYAAHEQLLSYATLHEMKETPSSTLVVSVLQDDQCHTAHCGDSRRYLVRDGAVLSRTIDHSVAEWNSSARSLVQTAPVSRHVLYSCLGAPRQPVIEVSAPIDLRLGDRLLLCSDGLWSGVQDDDIVYGLTQHAVADAAYELAELAVQYGGPHCDNVTLIAVAWEKADNSAPT